MTNPKYFITWGFVLQMTNRQDGKNVRKSVTDQQLCISIPKDMIVAKNKRNQIKLIWSL